MSSSNHIKRIAMVGAGGQSGSYIVTDLIKSGRFEITALTREDSKATMPEGLNHIAKVDYNDISSLTSALQGIDCLIITMSVFAGPEASAKLIQAAAAAKVPWVMPNEWGIDHMNEAVARETMTGEAINTNRKLIRDLGVSNYVAFCCSFWYEYSLTAGPWAYGFDWEKKHVTFYDNGDTPISTTTWPKVGAGVTALLSLPIHRESGVATDKPVLDDFKNQCCFVQSFRLTQKDMLASILRVTGAKETDWTTSYQSATERYAEGMKEMQAGSRMGFGKCLYSRMFYPDMPGDFEGRGLGHNDVLGLEQEDLDQRTKVAVERFQERGHLTWDH